MTSLFRALHAELLKLKRTLAFRVIFVLPFLVALLQFFIIWRTPRFGPNVNFWHTLPTNSLQVWAVFMMPLLITLETALLNGVEHSDKQWKHLFALPIPRHSIYFSKLVVAQALILVSTFVLAVLTVLVGVAATHMKPDLANAGPVPYLWIAKQTAYVWLASWLIIAIHTWISMRWSGFAIALGAGIGGTFFALFAASASVGKYYPWLLPMN
ncbi:MAG TPA: ABC transporter permease, partial [Pyrinomonadaceae bacterium]|nr:ABC transporter permease [Pyrinomonadaceae bacterium]